MKNPISFLDNKLMAESGFEPGLSVEFKAGRTYKGSMAGYQEQGSVDVNDSSG